MHVACWRRAHQGAHASPARAAPRSRAAAARFAPPPRCEARSQLRAAGDVGGPGAQTCGWARRRRAWCRRRTTTSRPRAGRPRARRRSWATWSAAPPSARAARPPPRAHTSRCAGPARPGAVPRMHQRTGGPRPITAGCFAGLARCQCMMPLKWGCERGGCRDQVLVQVMREGRLGHSSTAGSDVIGAPSADAAPYMRHAL